MTLKNILGFAVGPIGAALLGFISLPIITWFFSQEDIGRLSMLQITISFSLLLFSLGLDQAFVREYHENGNKAKVLLNTFMPSFLLIGIATLGLSYFLEELAFLLFSIGNKSLAVLVIVCLQASFVSRYLSLVLRMQEKGLAYSMSQILPKLLFLMLVGSYFLLDAAFNTFQLLLAHTFSVVMVLLIYAWNTRKDWQQAIRHKIDFQFIKFTLAYSFPLIFGGLAYWGLTATDKIFIRWLSDFNELGVYSVAISFASVATLFQSVFTTVWAPVVYRWVGNNENLDKLMNVNSYVLFVVVALFCATGLFSWVIDLIIPASYAQVKYIVVACLGFPLLYTLSEATAIGIGVTRRTLFSFAASIIALLLNIVLNYWLIPKHGAAGAAVSTCVSFWLFFVLRTEFAIYVWKKIPRMKLYTFSTACVFLASAQGLIGDSYKFLFMMAWTCLFVVLLAVNKKMLMEAHGYARKRCIRMCGMN